MARGKGNGPGRPPLEVDPEKVAFWASKNLSDELVARAVGCSVETLKKYPDLTEALEKGRAHLNHRLLNKQADLALAGNVTMLIWLGKQRLGQKDRQDVTTGDQPLKTEPRSIRVEFVTPKQPKARK